jgi:hypothetical protein
MATTYIVRRGETLTLYLEAVTGDPTTASNLTVKLKPAQNGAAPPASVPAVATLQTTYQATSPGPGILPGWYILITAVQSAALALGSYFTDAAFQVAGSQFVTDPICIVAVDPTSIP